MVRCADELQTGGGRELGNMKGRDMDSLLSAVHEGLTLGLANTIITFGGIIVDIDVNVFNR